MTKVHLPTAIDSVIKEFEAAAIANSEKGSHPPESWKEIEDDYTKVKEQLRKEIRFWLDQSYKAGDRDGDSRAHSRPGAGDMGG